MTSPQRIRRRQRIEIILILCMLAGMVFQQWYFGNRDESHTKCLEAKVREMNKAFTARSALSAAEFTLVDATIFGVVNATNQKQVEDALELYRENRVKLQEARRNNPVPPFPESECDTK